MAALRRMPVRHRDSCRGAFTLPPLEGSRAYCGGVGASGSPATHRGVTVCRAGDVMPAGASGRCRHTRPPRSSPKNLQAVAPDARGAERGGQRDPRGALRPGKASTTAWNRRAAVPAHRPARPVRRPTTTYSTSAATGWPRLSTAPHSRLRTAGAGADAAEAWRPARVALQPPPPRGGSVPRRGPHLLAFLGRAPVKRHPARLGGHPASATPTGCTPWSPSTAAPSPRRAPRRRRGAHPRLGGTRWTW